MGRFDNLRGEDVFSVPFFIYLAQPERLATTEELRNGWLNAARYELSRASASPYRRFHSPLAYRAVMDREFRARLIAAASTG